MSINNVIALNANSIKTFNRKILLELFIRNHRAAIYLISETNLKPNDNFNFSGFNIIRQDRVSSNGGGTAIILDNKIIFRNVKKYQNKFEATTVDIFIDNEWMLIAAVYVPPNIKNNNGKIVGIDAGQFDVILNTKYPILAGGDFNARHISFGDCSNNSNGIKFKKYLDDGELIDVHPDTPTCFRNSEGSFIDFFVCSKDIYNDNNGPCTKIESFSDHNAIRLKFEFNLNNNTAKPLTTIKTYNFTNIKKLNQFIENKISNLNILTGSNMQNGELNNVANSIENIFTEAIDKFVPTKQLSTGKIILSQQTLKLQAESKKLAEKSTEIDSLRI